MIHPLACIGEPPEHREHPQNLPGIEPMIDRTARIEAFCTVDSGLTKATWIGARVWAMKGCHVGHDVYIADDCELAPHCVLGGHVSIGRGARLGMNATIKPFVTIGAGARIGCGAVVIRDVPAGEVWAGNPARCIHAPEREMTPSEAAGWDALVEAAR